MLGKKDYDLAAMEVRVLTRVVVDIACLAAVGVPILLLKYLATPPTQGFYCGDLTIGYPYHGSTIPTSINVSVSYGIPFIIILFFNISKTFINGGSVFAAVKQVWEDITLFLFGVFTVQVLHSFIFYPYNTIIPNKARKYSDGL